MYIIPVKAFKGYRAGQDTTRQDKTRHDRTDQKQKSHAQGPRVGGGRKTDHAYAQTLIVVDNSR